MKVVAILPGYKCGKTLRKFVEDLPKKYFDEIIFIDDCSPDNGFEVAKKIKGLYVDRTLRNLGYGGNLKMCLGTALAHGADVIMEIHPDGEYRFDGVAPAIEEVKRGAKMVLGNRFSAGKNALQNGMYWWKYPVVWLINQIDNKCLGTSIPDLHQGFRVYTRELLEKVDFRSNDNNYIFSFEIIAQAARAGLKIASVPVSTKYEGEKRGASFRASLDYTLGTFGVLLRKFRKPGREAVCPNCGISYLVEQRGELFYCKICETGFLGKPPQKMEKYYPEKYWQWTGLRKIFFTFFQKRRTKWIETCVSRGRVLEVGCGENLTKLRRNIQISGIDPYSHGQGILKKNFLTWKSKDKFDAVIFWESLEHTQSPLKYLEKASQLLKPNGFVLVEYPDYGGWESRFFGDRWYHLDIPRHLSQLTRPGIPILGKRAGFETKINTSVMAWEYTVWGVVASMVGRGRSLENNLNYFVWILLLPALAVALVLELALCIASKSPIILYVGKKM